MLSEFPAAKRHLEEKGRQILTKMGMLEENREGGEQEAATVESKVNKLEVNLESLHTKLARLMVELESSNLKMQARVEQLEWEVAAHSHLPQGQEDTEGVQGRGEGVGRGGTAGKRGGRGGGGAGGLRPEDEKTEAGRGRGQRGRWREHQEYQRGCWKRGQ